MRDAEPLLPLEQTGLDPAWYLGRYPDVDRQVDPALHYHLIGWLQFRDPAPWFSTAAYLKAHPDVAAAQVDPLEHWLRFGRTENRAVFDADTSLDEVRPHRAVAADLMALSGTVETVARAGQADDLDGLARYLVEQLDIVARAVASLADADAGRSARLARAIEGWSVSEMLRAVAADTLARFPPLVLPELETPDVTVIIPAFGQFATTYGCIASLLANLERAGFEVVLVDDASMDETVFASFVFQGGIRILRQPRNLGFVGAVNAAAAVARGRLLLLLNNDTLVQPGWLDALVDTLDANAGIGIAGSRLLGPGHIVQDCGGIVWSDGTACNIGRGGDPGQPELCRMRGVDYVSGAALMVSAALFRSLGGLDEAYAPGYYEDTDLCFRVRAAGLRVVVQPASTITHLEGVTAGRSGQDGMKRFQDRNRAVFLRRWADILVGHAQPGDLACGLGRHEPRIALFIDETTPTPDRDAGSNAAFSHMQALQRLGFSVQFVPSHNMAYSPGYTEALERVGVLCHRAPWASSAEAVLRQFRGPLALVYLHRMHSAVQYTGLVRRHFPGTRILFNVADLHHLRLQREAEVTSDAALMRCAEQVCSEELAAVRAVDGVIVHSSAEAALLARYVPEVPCTVMPWTVEARPVTTPFADRGGIAFVGGFNHRPNSDAASWLAAEIMPLVWRQRPGLELLLNQV